MLPVARARGSRARIALAIVRAVLRTRAIPMLVAIAWLGALVAFACLSRSSGALKRTADGPTFVVANQVFCVETVFDTCLPDDALAESAHRRVTHRPCKWSLPPCGNGPDHADGARSCVSVPVLTRTP